MKRFFLFVLLGLLNFQAISQQRRGFCGALTMGYAHAPGARDAVRTKVPLEISGLTNDFLLVGLNGYYRSGRLLVGLNGQSGLQKPYRSSYLIVEQFIGSAHVNAGFIIINRKNFWLYPSIGVGRSWLALKTLEPDKRGYFEISKSRYLFKPSFELALNADVPIVSASHEDETLAVIVGLSVGYRTSYGHNSRNFEHGIPNVEIVANRLEGWFITASVGFGFFRDF